MLANEPMNPMVRFVPHGLSEALRAHIFGLVWLSRNTACLPTRRPIMERGRKRSPALILGVILCLCITTLAFATTALAKEVKIVTWNVREMFSLGDVEARKGDLKSFGKEVNPDIVLLQEITSCKIVKKIAKQMGLKNAHIACSDFSQNDNNRHASFEVAIISRFPINQVIEYDPSPDNRVDENDPPELKLEAVSKIGIKPSGTSRGYLWAEIEELELTVAVVHLKSSLGKVGLEDASNAEKREFVIATVAAGVLEDADFFSGYSYLVAGDFNVGHSDSSKNGRSLKKDCFEACGHRDRYDETHALLGKGLVGGLKMENLVAGISTSTFPSFPGSPIDNIYVSGRREEDFESAQVPGDPSKTYGSDHLPVWTIYTFP